ncbi:MAG: hypothetical protein GAK31_03555 [Stenotrophomonas maltophilia]|uniref:SDR family NAD(P)-dependent oxidoreductase n=1 Tax=Stenotrophomonas maltophilia TaxID=40324 RepID=A0A7V8FDU9_STEMA|nr:MAG: hypothetical protein GAK31_03555 [Stenotrophomonas maltophilia]
MTVGRPQPASAEELTTLDIMIIGASKGLGRAFCEGLCSAGDTLTGVSRSIPPALAVEADVAVRWIEADLSQPRQAAEHIDAQAPDTLDVLVCNLGVWEAEAFSDAYALLAQSDDALCGLVDTNISATLLLLRRLLPRLLRSLRPRLLLTGSNSALRRSGRPEVAFGASKAALDGITDALREGHRAQRLAVTTLHLG